MYLFHNFDEPVIIDFKKELAKGEYETALEDLFNQKDRYASYKHNYIQAEEGANRLMVERNMDELNRIADQLRGNDQMKLFYGRLARKADFLLSKNKFPRAIGIFTLLVDIYPDSWKDWMKLGDAHHQSGDRSEAIVCYKKAIALNPDQDELKDRLKKIQSQ